MSRIIDYSNPNAPAGTVTACPPVTGPPMLPAVLTAPGVRPVVYQKAVNYSISVGTTPVNLLNNQPGKMDCDSFLIDCPSSAGNSVFFGYGSGVTTTSGIEIRPGLPQFFSPDNVREPWELQRCLEYIAGIIGRWFRFPTLDSYRAPRVVVDAGQWYLVATTTTTIAVMLFQVPEQQ